MGSVTREEISSAVIAVPSLSMLDASDTVRTDDLYS